MYKLKLSRYEKKQLLKAKWLILLIAVAGLAAVVWLAWVRPIQHAAKVNSFADCVRAGNAVQQTYPEVCLTKDGSRFVNPVQEQAHNDTRKRQATEVARPTQAGPLYLELEEWDVRVPLTDKTFDLMYSYFEDGISERLIFGYKRLLQAGFCKNDIGLTLTRSGLPNEPPYTPDKPAPTAQVGMFYYYVAYGGSPCYDTENAAHMALVKEIAGDQSLTQATTALLAKLEATPVQ
jgi:hypothetical protein